MILTIDINPTIERNYYIDEYPKSGEVIANSSYYNLGGRGIILAKLLGISTEDVLITGFLGGSSGEYYHKNLLEKNIMHKVITIKDEIRSRIIIRDEKNNEVSISEKGPRITRKELASFYNLYYRLLDDSEIIIGGALLPKGISKDIYYNLIRLSKKKEKIFILDGIGKELVRGIEASPSIVILSKREFENLVNLKLDFEKDIIRASKYVLDKGVEKLVINLGEKGILVLESSQGYRTEVLDKSLNLEVKDNAGIVAGFAIGIKRKYDMEMILKLAQAYNIACLLGKDNSSLDMSDIKKYMNKIKVSFIDY